MDKLKKFHGDINEGFGDFIRNVNYQRKFGVSHLKGTSPIRTSSPRSYGGTTGVVNTAYDTNEHHKEPPPPSDWTTPSPHPHNHGTSPGNRLVDGTLISTNIKSGLKSAKKSIKNSVKSIPIPDLQELSSHLQFPNSNSTVKREIKRISNSDIQHPNVDLYIKEQQGEDTFAEEPPEKPIKPRRNGRKSTPTPSLTSSELSTTSDLEDSCSSASEIKDSACSTNSACSTIETKRNSTKLRAVESEEGDSGADCDIEDSNDLGKEDRSDSGVSSTDAENQYADTSSDDGDRYNDEVKPELVKDKKDSGESREDLRSFNASTDCLNHVGGSKRRSVKYKSYKPPLLNSIRRKIPKKSVPNIPLSDVLTSFSKKQTEASARNISSPTAASGATLRQGLYLKREQKKKKRFSMASQMTKIRRKEWYSSCFCFIPQDPPQIEHVVSEQQPPNMISLMQPSTSTTDSTNLPRSMGLSGQAPGGVHINIMPPPEELRDRLTELLDELDLTASQKSGILNFPREKQAQLLYDYNTLQTTKGTIERPQTYIYKLQDYTKQGGPLDEYQESCWLRYTENLKTALATQPKSFVTDFIEHEGLVALLAFLSRLNTGSASLSAFDKKKKKKSKKDQTDNVSVKTEETSNGSLVNGEIPNGGVKDEGSTRDDGDSSSSEDGGEDECMMRPISSGPGLGWCGRNSPIHTQLIACFKALMNNSNGRKHILAHPYCMKVISQSLVSANLRTKTLLLEILGGVCLLPGGHKKVLEAMLHYQKFAGERTRFQTLVVDLDREEDLNLRIAIMSFINAIIRWGPGEESLEFRLHLRYDFLMLGIQPVIQKLRKLEDDVLDTHLDAFEFYRCEDEREWAKRFNELHMDTKSGSAMFNALHSRLQFSPSYPHLLSLLHHLLLLPQTSTPTAAPDHWALFDRLLQQIITQNPATGEDRETTVMQISVNDIVKELASERVMNELRSRLRTAEAELSDVTTQLCERELELERVTKEKNGAERSCEQLRLQVEAEVSTTSQVQSVNTQLEAQLKDVTAKLHQLSQQQQKLSKQQLQQLTEGSLSDDDKAIMVTKTPDAIGGTSLPPPPPPPPSAPIPPPPMPPLSSSGPPPPPPPIGGPPPPPGGPIKPSRPPKKVPKSGRQLRSFNWCKLPEARITGTIFSTLDESHLYKFMDLEEIDRTFDSSFGKAGETRTIERTKSCNRGQTNHLSFLESRRQQNCAILLSKLKLSDHQYLRVIESMDVDNILIPDMIEQLLKFVPTTEESQILEEHTDEVENFARADGFMLRVSRVVHYEERLKCMLYQKKFKERITDTVDKIKIVKTAAKQLNTTTSLPKLFEVVLAFGNYMNKGSRGSAFGFRISSLNKLTDTKASGDRNITLLHYIITVCQRQWSNVLCVDQEMKSVKDAAKISTTELEKDLKHLESGLEFIQKEVEWHRNRAGGSNSSADRFGRAMKEFLAVAVDTLADVRAQYDEMTKLFLEVSCRYGEGQSKMTPEEFFSIFDSFLESFSQAKKELEMLKKREEEEARKKKDAEKRKELELQRKKEKGLTGNLDDSGAIVGGNVTQHHGGQQKGGQQKEFDDLIYALRSGDVFGKDIDKMRRKKKSGK